MSDPGSRPAQTTEKIPIRRALISVSDKSGLVELAGALAAGGVEIVSTGSTARAIREGGVAVKDVADVTGFPEILDGRVKTLHPAIHAGILADTSRPEHRAQLRDHAIASFELVVVNLYPFRETVAAGGTIDATIENIDIGGPALVRAAAKNHHCVAVVVSPDHYERLADMVRAGGSTLSDRRQFALEAFSHTASYDAAISSWMATQWSAGESGFPDTLTVTAERSHMLRYGENSHQKAALYVRRDIEPGLAQAEKLHGKDMSYNNYVDADAAARAVYDFADAAVAIVKHANPCGIAVADPLALDPIASAYRRAHDSDPVSAFGGVVAANRRVTRDMAESLADVFTEVIVAPDFDDDALEVLRAKKNTRLLRLPPTFASQRFDSRNISGGILVQDADFFHAAGPSQWDLVCGPQANPDTAPALAFAWRACRSVKSNGIVLARDGATVGIGMGQVNRVDSCHLAVSRAGARAAGSVAASDAFFPFADGLQVLIEAGVSAVVQPGGSVRDDEVIAAAQGAGITMYFTGERHFFH